MKRASLLLLSLAILALPRAAEAQRQAEAEVPNWVSLWLGGYYDVGNVRQTEGDWRFGAGFAGGLGYQRQVSGGLALGVESSIARVPFESDRTPSTISGDATLLTAMATGRVRYGGLADLALNLNGGAGTLTYMLPELGNQTHFSLLTGAGLDYRAGSRWSLFAQWGRLWVFHQTDRVDTQTVHHNQLRGGVRYGW